MEKKKVDVAGHLDRARQKIYSSKKDGKNDAKKDENRGCSTLLK